MIDTILFDLDETLYPHQNGIMQEIRRLILSFVQSRLGLTPEDAEALRLKYLRTYGTTMRGLQIHHNIDAEDYLDYVHNIPLHVYIQPNPELDAALATIPHRKMVFTNASREHAARVLSVLGVAEHFSRIVDIRDMGFRSKPQPDAYTRVCSLLQVHPQQCMLVEDNLRNLQPAKAIGMVTVLVSQNSEDLNRVADYVLPRIEDIATLPVLLSP